MNARAAVWEWHRAEGCCKHPFPGGGDETACCVCDADDPCGHALTESEPEPFDMSGSTSGVER